jgi:gas vesicle protein
VSERGSGFGSFLLGLGLGAVLGFLFAPEPGDATRTKLTRRLRGLRDLATEKAGELGQLLEAGDDAADEPSAREALEHRLTDAKRRRRGARPAQGRGVEEEDEPLA